MGGPLRSPHHCFYLVTMLIQASVRYTRTDASGPEQCFCRNAAVR